MLQKLELQKYEKNFRKGMLTDETLHLVNDRFVPALTFSFYYNYVACISWSMLPLVI